MNLNKLILGICCLLYLIPGNSQDRIQKVEPPNWWTGMQNPELQLMIYGEQVANLSPKIQKEGVYIQEITRVENPNYLFLTLNMESNVAPGNMVIEFREKDEIIQSVNYQISARTSDGAAKKGFDNSDVLYLITPDRFANGSVANDQIDGLREGVGRDNKGGRHGGDIEGIRQHLDYIADLGFTSIWLNPLLENDMKEYSYHGYSTTDFYKVDPRFGSNESYRQLSQEAKQKGLKLIMDMIVNHCGLEHWWMKDLPSKNWINTWSKYTETNHRKSLLQDPYAAKIDHQQFTDGWFVPTMPDLNQRNKLLGNYLIQNSIWWIEYLDLAGIRMDTYPYPDMNFMTEWTERVMEEYPNFNVVGEEWYEDPAIVAYWQKGKENPNGYTSELTSLMDFPVQMAMSKALNEKEDWKTGWITLYEMLAQDFMYADASQLVIFPDNHDMSRIFTQVKENYALFQMALTFVATTRGVPQLYYGTEILMENPGTTDHGIIRSDFPGGWPKDSINGFTNQGLSKEQIEAKKFVTTLLNWRKKASAVHHGQLIHFIPKDGVYVYFRTDDQQKIMVILNKNETTYDLKLDRFTEVLHGHQKAKDILSNQMLTLKNQMNLPPMSVHILELE